MKKIVVLDIWSNSTNMGNQIIMQAVLDQLRDTFSGPFIYQIPAMEFAQRGKAFLQMADHVFMGGGNMLRANMGPDKGHWPVRWREAAWMRNIILMGVGWHRYQEKPFDFFTRTFLTRALSHAYKHSLRDKYTQKYLGEVMPNSINTGCPTLWRLTPDHCARIPAVKGANVMLTFTAHSPAPEADRHLFKTLDRNYSKIFFWPQQYEDLAYAQEIGGSRLTYLEPTLQAFDATMAQGDIDFVGARLHSGIRALQHQRRAIIIVVDNRAREMGRDFRLPVIDREKVVSELERIVTSQWPSQVQIDQGAIQAWKNQFQEAPSASR